MLCARNLPPVWGLCSESESWCSPLPRWCPAGAPFIFLHFHVVIFHFFIISFSFSMFLRCHAHSTRSLVFGHPSSSAIQLDLQASWTSSFVTACLPCALLAAVPACLALGLCRAPVYHPIGSSPSANNPVRRFVGQLSRSIDESCRFSRGTTAQCTSGQQRR